MLPEELWPSMIVDTRNGCQCYWFCKCNEKEIALQEWQSVEDGIYEYFKHCGADPTTLKPVQLLRLPYMQYYKNNEEGICDIVFPMSTGKFYEVKEMKKLFWKEEEKAVPVLRKTLPMNILDGSKDKIKSIPILDTFLRLGYQPKKRGNNKFVIPCPLHNEKDPSLMIYEDKNSWFCFGCKKGGDNIRFIEELKDCSYGEAIDFLKSI